MFIIDRRLNGKNKSAVNRQRFIQRYRSHIREAVADAISRRSITDMERGEKINIPKRDVREPAFRHGEGGIQEKVLPGNKEFTTGDRIKRPSSGGGGGSGKGRASDRGEAMDEFVFEISQSEFLDFMFEGLELPNLVKKRLKDINSSKNIRGGYVSEGIPARLNIKESLKNAYARRIALKAVSRKRIKDIEQLLKESHGAIAVDDEEGSTQERIVSLEAELERLQRRVKTIPFLDEFDLRYNKISSEPSPVTSAVMFCIMDVSGSMTQDIKDIAKRFFILLYLFLERSYKTVEVVFIRHHTSASEVDEETFFYSRETGGTIVSSALTLSHKIITSRYPVSDWNIYVAQASDGDNWEEDSPACHEILKKKLLPLVQYYTYVEISTGEHQTLWNSYNDLQADFSDRFYMKQIRSLEDIYPVFRKLFERKTA